VNASRSQGLSQASTVANSVIACLTPGERRRALIELVTAEVEQAIRENTRFTEREAQRRNVEEESERCRRLLEERHGRAFTSLEEANDFDDHEWAKKLAEKRREQDRRRQELAEQLMERLHMEWNASLLASSFALGDGTQTTWGEATVEQHEQRIRMLEANIRGNGEALQRHEAAVISIMEARVSTLNQRVGLGLAN
jgi:hypothetical protein